MSLIKIDFPAANSARGTLTCGGNTYPVLGKKGFQYVHDLTVNVSDKRNPHFSTEFQCNMPYAICLDGTRGIYLHQDCTSPLRNLSHSETHGCINLAQGDAQQVYEWMTGRTRVLITYKW